MSNAIIKTPQTVRDLSTLVNQHKDRLFAALPTGIDGEAVVKKAMFLLRKDQQLLRCTPQSLFFGIAEALANGLEIGGIRNEAYFVRYGDQAVLIPGYKGYLKLVRNTGELLSVSAQLVHECDEFEHVEGDSPKLRHVPSTSPDRESSTVTHVYCVWHLKSGQVIRNVWTASQVQAHKERYSEGWKRAESYRLRCEEEGVQPDAKKLSAWHTAWRQMAIKTVLRDTINRGFVPMSESVQQLFDRQDQIEARVSTSNIPSTLPQLTQALNDVFPDDDPDVDAEIEAEPVESQEALPEPLPDVPQYVDIKLFTAPDGTVDEVMDGINEQIAGCSTLGELTAVIDIRRKHAGDDPGVLEALEIANKRRGDEIRKNKSKRASK